MDAQDTSGRWLDGASAARLRDEVRNALLDEGSLGLDEAAAAVAAQRCSAVLLDLLGLLRLCLDRPTAVAFNACKHTSMRIVVAADTNSAANHVLSYVDADEAFRAKGFKVLRLGLQEKVSFMSLVPLLCCCAWGISCGGWRSWGGGKGRRARRCPTNAGSPAQVPHSQPADGGRRWTLPWRSATAWSTSAWRTRCTRCTCSSAARWRPAD